MKKNKVLVTGIIPKEGLNELRQKLDVFYNPKITTRDWVLEHLHEYQGLILKEMKGDRELIDAGPNLKIISTFGVGFDHIDISYAKQKEIVVANCPQTVRVPTAEMALTLILATARHLHQYDQIIRSGQWADVSKPQYMGTSLQGKTLGIFGMGRIGLQVAQYCQMLGMKVIYHNRHQLSADQEELLHVSYVDFPTLIKTADVITLHAPATPETKGVFNHKVFNEMKKTAYLVNTARGSLIKENDLVQALRNHQIAGAGLDVFEQEPLVTPELRTLDNVVLSPHAHHMPELVP